MDFKNTALVLVDLQKDIANNVQTAPHSVSTVLNNATRIVVTTEDMIKTLDSKK